jgi:hypothetical protein
VGLRVLSAVAAVAGGGGGRTDGAAAADDGCRVAEGGSGDGDANLTGGVDAADCRDVYTDATAGGRRRAGAAAVVSVGGEGRGGTAAGAFGRVDLSSVDFTVEVDEDREDEDDDDNAGMPARDARKGFLRTRSSSPCRPPFCARRVSRSRRSAALRASSSASC